MQPFASWTIFAALAFGAAPVLAQLDDQENLGGVSQVETIVIENALDRVQAPTLNEPPPAGDVEVAPSIPGETVIFRGLDKLTGEVDTFEVQVGAPAQYGRLTIDPKTCYARPAARAPDSSVFVQILDTKTEPETVSFSGWMFSSSPALSAMDHPRYDVWLLSCKTS